MIPTVQQIGQEQTSRPKSVSETDARIKVSLAVFAILVAALIPVGQWWAFVCMWSLVLGISINLRIDVRTLLIRSMLVLPFSISAVPLIFQNTPDFFISLGNWNLGINQAGWFHFLAIVVKSLISVQIATLLIMTTPYINIMSALHYFRIPEILIAVMTLMWRYLEVIVGEAQRMMQARLARSACVHGKHEKSGGNILFRASVTGGMAGSLFVRSLERSERVYQAMLARGYDGTTKGVEMTAISPLSSSIGIIGFSLLSGILFLAYWLR